MAQPALHPAEPVVSASAPKPGSALLVIALYFVLQLVAGGTIGLLIGLISVLTGSGAGHRPDMARIRTLLSQPDIGALLVIATLLVSAFVIARVIRRTWPELWKGSQPPGFGLASRGAAAFYLLAVVFGLALPVIGSWLTQWLAHGRAVTQDIKQLGGATTLALRLPLVLVATTVGPLVEELLFRGVLLSALLRRCGTGWAVLASSLLFACVHLPDLGYLWYAVPNLALLGAVLAWLRLRSGSLWPAVLAHGLNNLLAVLAWFVVVNPAS